MSTKNNPGPYPCYQNADPDEEMFILLGRDPMAGELVRTWAEMRALEDNADSPKLEEARACAARLDDHARKLGKGERVAAARELLLRVVGAYGIDGDAPKGHVDHFIDDHNQDNYARFVLMYLRFPAAWQMHFRPFWFDKLLFCTHGGQRYRVTMASRFGHICLSENFDKEYGYQTTVNVTECSEWSPAP